MQTDPQTSNTSREYSTSKLEECMRGELSAVETYELALKSVTHVALHHSLQEILDNHTRRVEWLRDRLSRQGATPVKSSGVWGAFTKAVQMGADLLGNRTAIASLEEGEDRGMRLYTKDLDECDMETRTFITTQLLPEQQYTHDLCRTLKKYVNAPS